MKIYIHTYGRANNQLTWRCFPPVLQQRCALVVQEREAHLYANHTGEVLVLPSHIQMLSPTRQWIIEYHYEKYGVTDPKLCLIDDDLRRFDKRRTDNPSLFLVGTDQDTLDVFRLLNEALDTYAHAGVLAREGGNRILEPYLLAHRMMRILAYDSRVLHKTGARFDRVPCKQDFDMTLQLLRAGYPNYVITAYVQGQGGGNSNTPGGCSSYRTQQMMTEACHTLAALHPGFVKVVQKTTKSSWGATEGNLVTRDEVSIQWKKAYASSGAGLLDTEEDILS